MTKEKAVVIISGGMDSTTLLYDVIDHGFEVYTLSFNYGQRHVKELEMAKKTCRDLGISHKIVELQCLNELLQGSSLTSSDIPTPHGKYDDKNMASTVVPMRNAIMLSIASGYAISIKSRKVFYGAHGGDHEIYWDCRHRFIDGFNSAIFDQSANSKRGRLSPEYIIGFWEGEGFVGGEPRIQNYPQVKNGSQKEYKYKRVPIVVFCQNDIKILKEIQQFFFGAGCVHSKGFHKYYGHGYTPIKPNKESNEMFSYKLSGHDCRVFVDLIKNGKLLKTDKKIIQFNKWYKEFEEYLTKVVPRKIGINDKKEYIVTPNGVEIKAPYLDMDKGDIVKIGIKLKVPFENTWTCYEGGEVPCGKCGACQEREEAFKKAGIEDPLLKVK